MAACSSLEDKTSSSKDTLPLKIFVPDAVNHAMRENCYREFPNVTKNSEALSKVKMGDLKKLSIDEFQDLLEEASTFNKPNNQESVLLKQLREEVKEEEKAAPPLDETQKVRDEGSKGFHQSHSLQDLATSDSGKRPSDPGGPRGPYPPILDPRDIPLPDEMEMEEIRDTGDSRRGGNSKFYVDYNDIDTTVTFPLKFVSNVEEQSGSMETMSDQIKRQMTFPMVPWPSRPFEVRSFFSSMPLDTDSTRNDKQLLNTDVNGNPFSKSRQNANIASLVSSSLIDYGGGAGGLLSEGKNRKNKRLRNTADKGVLSESIEGHRGQEDIDALLKFINSSDKKGKAIADKKKSLGKKNAALKKKTGSTENLVSGSDDDAARPFEVDANAEAEGGKDSSSTEESGTGSPAPRRSSPELSGFAADFYSTADVSSQTVEESGFLIVKKKQRKKHQGKRSDSYRWRMSQTQCKKGIMLPLAESQCGKQDSRRKSTSSVPHSDHSSADNSDLDSVHSLPVRGSVPHPKQPHPHTTPSSSSSTPQASYADIARMPISKLNASPSCVANFSSQAATQCNGVDTPAKLRPDERPEMRVRSSSKSTREINTQTEPCLAKECKRTEDGKHACSCVQKKSGCSHRHRLKGGDMPPVIMDDVPPGACDVSFGFGIEEVLRMAPPRNREADPRTHSTDPSSHCRTVCYGTGRNLCYTETKVNIKKFNLSEIASFFGKEFQCIEREIGVSRTNSRVVYYAEEA